MSDVVLSAERHRPLLIGEGVGIGPLVQVCEQLRTRTDAPWQPLVLLGSDMPFPFRTRPSLIVVPGMPDGVIASMPLLEEWGIASRLASRSDFPGCFDGSVTELATIWLHDLAREALTEVSIVASGPALVLEATAALAARFGLPWQVVGTGLAG